MTKASKILIVAGTLLFALSAKAQDKLISTNWNLEDNQRHVAVTFGNHAAGNNKLRCGRC
jgi:hypothetical protein